MSAESSIYKSFPWYLGTTALQNYKKPQCSSECFFQLISPKNGMLPFQIQRPSLYSYSVDVDISIFSSGLWYTVGYSGLTNYIPGSIAVSDISDLQTYLNTLNNGVYLVTQSGSVVTIKISNAIIPVNGISVIDGSDFASYNFTRISLPISSFEICCPDGSSCLTVDTTDLFDYYIDGCGREFISYNGKPLGVTIPCGYHMGVLTDGLSTWYSEMFYVPPTAADITPICYLTDHNYIVITTENTGEPIETC